MQFDQLRRREFIALIAGMTAVRPLAAAAQLAGRVPTIGVLGGATAAAEGQRIAAFAQRLRELGWIEGRTVAIEYRWAEGRGAGLAEIAAEFVRLSVDIILATGTAPALAAKQATSVIPTVFAFAGDPLGTGLVASLTRPGGNVTGLSNQGTDLVGKRIELLREIVPVFRRLAVLANANYPAALLEMGEAQAAARTLGIEVAAFEVRGAKDIAPTFEALKSKAEALFVVGDPLINANRLLINTLALAGRLPAVYVHREYVEAGGLVSYGPNFRDLFRRAAEIVDKVLRGAKPADIPVEQPTKFELVINLTTAKALGLEVPPTLLARADEVIE
jgi:putative tryptophan/tyrosine transport system substrate-binding protein